jgi:prepilin-type N-terminal cleavage/methylation domain-containing protein
LSGALGFSLTEMLMTIAVGATMAAVAVPSGIRAIELMRLSSAARDVERELQTARLRSVSANRPIRVRLNCPAAGQLRVIELTGVAETDEDAGRCDPNRFPFPGPRDGDRATPELDGPLRILARTVTVAGSDVEFTPRGTAREVLNGGTQPIGTPLTITVSSGANSVRVFVNGLGKVHVE